MHRELTLEIQPQPTDETCGPTCLHAVYRYLGDELPLERVVDEVIPLHTGGTLAAHLGSHALERGYRATIYSFNLEVLDPTWFENDDEDLVARLQAQAAAKGNTRIQVASDAYVQYLRAGGALRFEELRPELLREPLAHGTPIMAGLSATYLYGSARERFVDGVAVADPVSGEPTGHFVVLHGYDATTDSVLVADPYHDNPYFGGPKYRVGLWRLLGAILLGVITHDGNLLLVERRG